MVNKEKLNKILNPISIRPHISDELIYGKWDDISWAFHIYRNKNFKKGKNLHSICFFLIEKIDEVYSFQRTAKNFTEGHQEQIKRYFRGIHSIINEAKKSKLDITVRIYCDVTTAIPMAKYLYEYNVELYVYFFPQFFDFNKMCHYGFFGTLIRYLPLFKLEKHNEDEWNSVIVSDVDTDFKKEIRIVRYYLNDDSLPNIFFRNRSCYFLVPRILYLNMVPPCFSIISNLLMQKKSQDFTIFKDFLQNCLLKSCEHYENSIKKYILINLSKQPLNGKVEYGVDEYFINYIFLQKCYIEKNLDLLEVFIKDNDNPFYRWFRLFMYFKQDIKYPEVLKQFLKIFGIIFFGETYKIPDKSIPEIIEIYYKEFENREIQKTKISEEKYNTIIDLIKKIGPEKLNMPSTIYTCLERARNAVWDKNVIRLVKPNPKYPEFTEKIINTFPLKN